MPRLAKPLASVEVRFAPDPWLVGATHLRFHQMNPTKVSLFCYTTQERTDCYIFTIIGITHFYRYNVSEVFRNESRTVYRRPFFHERNKPAQDISPPLLHPYVYVIGCWSYIWAKDSTAESALLTWFFFRCYVIHFSFYSLFIRYLDNVLPKHSHRFFFQI